MKEIEKLSYAKLLATLDLQKAMMEHGNNYVYGWDDARRELTRQIENLTI